jgi:hypothetical protein
MAASRLADDDEGEELRRELVRRFLIRRVQYLKIGGRSHSKNMYRREWRLGGYERHDDPMTLTDPKQRLIVGLIQKKVAEILGDRRFNNSFQIGMLSSFESFMQSLARSKRLKAAMNGDEDEDEVNIFDGDQEATRVEKQGIDSHSLEAVVKSYREHFEQELPHPKLDATAGSLADAFTTGEKALVFVRRIATVTELKRKLDASYDKWIETHMRCVLPDLSSEVDGIFDRYRRAKRGLEETTGAAHLVDERETAAEERSADLEEDAGGIDSFFAWFFRGKGPDRLLSGAAFQKNRLGNVSSAYATLFEDDYVAWLLGRPADVIERLCQVTGKDGAVLLPELRKTAYAYFRHRTTRRDGYPRLYVFESYQHAGLSMLADVSSEPGDKAREILHERFESGLEPVEEPPEGFPDPDQVFGAPTFFTELVKRDDLRKRLWPDPVAAAPFREQFRQREERRELLSAMARLGAAYIDLYFLAIRRLGSFDLRVESRQSHPVETLIADYLDLLESQMRGGDGTPAFNAFYELSAAADAFDTLVAVNFPELRDAPMSQFATILARVLQHQTPVGHMFGGVNKRLVKQFRMPGYPLVLATTDVLQEGEDLHTFCRRVIHYGITWTPSAMEQRTGRVDRIGSLVQRRLDGSDREPRPDELIQVYYPHLSDTVERLQVRCVLQRLNKFLHLIHKTAPRSVVADSKVDLARKILEVESEIPRIEGLLESDFPAAPGWREGELRAADIARPDLSSVEEHFRRACESLQTRMGVDVLGASQRHSFRGRLAVADRRLIPWSRRHEHPRHREQPFELVLRSQATGEAVLIRCISPVGKLDLRDDETVDWLYNLQWNLGMIRICARPDAKDRQHHVSVGLDRLFHVETTQQEEIDDIVRRAVLAADHIESEFLEGDTESAALLARQHEEGADE